LAAALALAVGQLGYTAHAAERLAAPPEFLSASSGEHWQAVDDDVLSHQTGKGAGGMMISGLVLQLLSQWQMPNGGSASAQGTLTVSTNANNALSAQVTTSAQASDGPGRGNGNAYGVVNGNGNGNANVNTNSGHGNNSATTTTAAVVTAPPAGNGGALPTVSAGAPANAGNITADNRATGANPQATATGGQAVSVSGVSQITQVAGNGNVGTNSTVIDFNSSTPTPLAGAAATNPTTSAGSAPSTGTGTIPSTTVTTTASTNAGPNASPNAINASATATSASGNVKAGITFAGGGVAVMVQTPAGIATQTIAPANAQGSGSIAQLLQVAGNGQAVVNQLKLSVQTQPMSAALLRQLGVLQALQNSAVLRH
jgi:hypothetical protein